MGVWEYRYKGVVCVYVSARKVRKGGVFLGRASWVWRSAEHLGTRLGRYWAKGSQTGSFGLALLLASKDEEATLGLGLMTL